MTTPPVSLTPRQQQRLAHYDWWRRLSEWDIYPLAGEESCKCDRDYGKGVKTYYLLEIRIDRAPFIVAQDMPTTAEWLELGPYCPCVECKAARAAKGFAEPPDDRPWYSYSRCLDYLDSLLFPAYRCLVRVPEDPDYLPHTLTSIGEARELRARQPINAGAPIPVAPTHK